MNQFKLNRLAMIAVCAAGMLSQGVAVATMEPDKEQLKVLFKARDADVREAKKKGQIGETLDGYLAAVDATSAADSTLSALIKSENDDRKVLYRLLAEEINAENPNAPLKATAETIGVRNAQRNVEKAGADEFLKVGKDHWIRIKDFSRFQKLTTYKTQGKVGETSTGMVEAVDDAAKADKVVARLIEEENKARTSSYAELAEKENVSADEIAKRMATRNTENARIGDMLKDASGAWRKK